MEKFWILVLIYPLMIGGMVTSSCDMLSPSDTDTISLNEVEYVETRDVIINPERGFYKHFSRGLGVDESLNLENIQGIRADGYSLILLVYYLKEYRHKELDNRALGSLEQDMEILRKAGLKCILRFAYSGNPDEPDAPLSTIQMHLDQLQPWFAVNFDVIAVMQAGFIGAWGEWYYTSNKLNNSGAQATVLNKILEVLPDARMVQVRTPTYKMNFVQSKEPGKFADAFNGSTRSRVGHHNDCFLASQNDYGTYENVDVEKAYIHQDALYVPVGGETCPPTDVEPANCSRAIEEMRYLRWTYLNQDYFRGVNDRWIEQGCMDEIRRNLGYRLVLRSGQYSPEISPGHTLDIQLVIENAGYASMFNPRWVELILANDQTEDTWLLRLDEDPRFWKPGEKVTLNVQAGIPPDIVAGNYQLYFNLPDPGEGLYGNPFYSIRLANEGTWQPSTGFNDLKMPIVISDQGATKSYEGNQFFQRK